MTTTMTTIPAAVRPGVTLVNGFTVVATTPRGPRMLLLAVQTLPSARVEYATWMADPDTGSTVCGYYYATFAAAVEGFNERAAREFPVRAPLAD